MDFFTKVKPIQFLEMYLFDFCMEPKNIQKMKNYFLLLISVLLITACKTNKKEIVNSSEDIIKDNLELIEIYKNDQNDRKVDNIDWKVVSVNDSLREQRVHQLLDSNKVRTAKDYHNAAMVFQHGGDSTAYGLAVKLMKKSIELDPTADKWLLAATIDRYLLSKDEPQIYGTQYQRFGRDQPWQLGKMDTTKITDEERIEYGVETLAEQKEKVKRLNQKKIIELYNTEKDLDNVLSFIEKEFETNEEYNLSESGINSFGYHFMGIEEYDNARKIFKLNTKLFPNAFNTHDSYGESLLALNKKEEGIKAYKKSVELNPNNNTAKEIIDKNK